MARADPQTSVWQQLALEYCNSPYISRFTSSEIDFLTSPQGLKSRQEVETGVKALCSPLLPGDFFFFFTLMPFGLVPL